MKTDDNGRSASPLRGRLLLGVSVFVLGTPIAACGSNSTPAGDAGANGAGSSSAGAANVGGTSVAGGSGASAVQPSGGTSGAPAGGVGGTENVAGAVQAGASGSAGNASGGSAGSGQSGGAAGVSNQPLLAVLDQFSAANVPVRGPKESPPINRGWTAPATLPIRPGAGLAQHPMLYAGESYNMLFVVNGGKVVWSYATAPGGEIDDVWMLSNGHILYSHMTFVEELSPQKEVIWHYDPPAGSEIHTCQPLGLDKVLFVQNGNPPKLLVINKASGAVELEHALDQSSGVHGQFRRFRKTGTGHYLAPYFGLGRVVEYDQDFKVLWTYKTSAWAAIPLKNGNTLLQIESASAAREIDAQGNTIWEFKKSDLPSGLMQGNTQTANRLANGNTVIFSNGTDTNLIQAVEVTPTKQVVWALQDWKDLGPATAAQFLDEPGIPENPGEVQH